MGAIKYSPGCGCCGCLARPDLWYMYPRYLPVESAICFQHRKTTTRIRTYNTVNVKVYEDNVEVSSDTSSDNTDNTDIVELDVVNSDLSVGKQIKQQVTTYTFPPVTLVYDPPEAETDPDGVGDYTRTHTYSRSIRTDVDYEETSRLAIRFDTSGVPFGEVGVDSADIIKDIDLYTVATTMYKPSLISIGFKLLGFDVDGDLPADTTEMDALVAAAANSLEKTSGFNGGDIASDLITWDPGSAASTVTILLEPHSNTARLGADLSEVRLAIKEHFTGTGTTRVKQREHNDWTHYFEFEETSERVWTTKKKMFIRDCEFFVAWNSLNDPGTPDDVTPHTVVMELIDEDEPDADPILSLTIEILGQLDDYDPDPVPQIFPSGTTFSDEMLWGRLTLEGLGFDEELYFIPNTGTSDNFCDLQLCLYDDTLAIVSTPLPHTSVSERLGTGWRADTTTIVSVAPPAKNYFWKEDGAINDLGGLFLLRDTSLPAEPPGSLKFRVRTSDSDLLIAGMGYQSTIPLTDVASTPAGRVPFGGEDDIGSTSGSGCRKSIHNGSNVLSYTFAGVTQYPITKTEETLRLVLDAEHHHFPSNIITELPLYTQATQFSAIPHQFEYIHPGHGYLDTVDFRAILGVNRASEFGDLGVFLAVRLKWWITPGSTWIESYIYFPIVDLGVLHLEDGSDFAPMTFRTSQTTNPPNVTQVNPSVTTHDVVIDEDSEFDWSFTLKPLVV